METVRKAKDLRNAVKNKENIIIVEGYLASIIMRVKNISGFSSNTLKSMADLNNAQAIKLVKSSFITEQHVAIVAIITFGVVVLVAILKDYNVEAQYEDKKVRLKRK